MEEVLTDTDFQSQDGMRWIPHLALLEDMQRWGWLTFSMLSEPDSETGFVNVAVMHKPLCKELLAGLRKRANGSGSFASTPEGPR